LQIEICQWTHPQPAHLAVISDLSATPQTSKVTGDARRGHTNAGSQLMRTVVSIDRVESRTSPGKFISRELTTLNYVHLHTYIIVYIFI